MFGKHATWNRPELGRVFSAFCVTLRGYVWAWKLEARQRLMAITAPSWWERVKSYLKINSSPQARTLQSGLGRAWTQSLWIASIYANVINKLSQSTKHMASDCDPANLILKCLGDSRRRQEEETHWIFMITHRDPPARPFVRQADAVYGFHLFDLADPLSQQPAGFTHRHRVTNWQRKPHISYYWFSLRFNQHRQKTHHLLFPKSEQCDDQIGVRLSLKILCCLHENKAHFAERKWKSGATGEQNTKCVESGRVAVQEECKTDYQLLVARLWI